MKSNISINDLAAEISKNVTAHPAIVAATRFSLILSLLAFVVAAVALGVAVSK